MKSVSAGLPGGIPAAGSSRGSGRLLRRLRALRVLFREGGLRTFLGAFRPFLFCSQRIEVFALDLSHGYDAPRLDPRAEIRKGTPEDLVRFRALPEGHRSEFYRDEIDGAEPFVAFWDGKPAHIAWMYDSAHPTQFIRLKPGEAVMGYGYTCKDFRGRGLYGATSAVMAAELSRRGYQRAYGYVIEDSLAFRLGLEWAVCRIGFRKVGTLRYLRVLGTQLRPHLSL